MFGFIWSVLSTIIAVLIWPIKTFVYEPYAFVTYYVTLPLREVLSYTANAASTLLSLISSFEVSMPSSKNTLVQRSRPGLDILHLLQRRSNSWFDHRGGAVFHVNTLWFGPRPRQARPATAQAAR